MARLRLAFLAIVASTVLGTSAVRAGDFPIWGNETYDDAIQTPSEFFGIELGSRFTPHHDVLRYAHYVAGESPRAQFQSYGRTAEGRELFYLVISDAANLGRLDDIVADQKRLADSRLVADDAELSALIARQPAIAWMSYNVHGNEASATEAALRTIYQLVDGSDAATTAIRKDTVVILDPLLNPDGRERYLSWYHQVAVPGGDPNPRSREHDEPWPGGRSNHYYFDLNRDWSWLSQIETRSRAPHYLKWQPLVHGDFHEMSPESSYFFFPAEEPINKNFTEHTLRWGKTFGRANADAFDRYGWLYYTEESFDLFYPGYGDSWPSLHGAIGMTYEQGGGPRAGTQYRRRDGSILTLHDRLHHHVVSSMATLECTAREKAALQKSFFEFRKGAVEGTSKSVTEYVFPPDQGYRLDSLVSVLRGQGIELEQTSKEYVAESLTDHFGRSHDLVRLPAGTVIVPLTQPAGRLAKALLEPDAEVSENRFYDISAWSLPFSMGLKAFASGNRVEVDRQPMPATIAREGVVDREARFSYLLPWDGVPAARALHALQSSGIRARLVPEKIRIGGETYANGCLQVPVRGNKNVHEAVARVAKQVGVRFRAVDSGMSEEGIDLGSDKVLDLAQPKVAVASGSGVSSGGFGAIWYLFERDLEIPFTAFDLESFDRLDLPSYNVLVLPSGSGYGKYFSGERAAGLKAWVRNGGVLIAVGRAAFALTKEESGFTSVSRKVSDDPKKEAEAQVRRKIRELRAQRRVRQVPGNIFRVDLDADHPLALGLPSEVFVYMGGTDSFAVSGTASDVGAFPEDPAISGYITKESELKVSKRIYLAEESFGRGRVILFADDPNFRLFWRGLTRLFLNSVFLRTRY